MVLLLNLSYSLCLLMSLNHLTSSFVGHHGRLDVVAATESDLMMLMYVLRMAIELDLTIHELIVSVKHCLLLEALVLVMLTVCKLSFVQNLYCLH